VASIRICYHFREGGEPIGLAEVGDVSQGSFELPDFPFMMPIRLVHQGNVGAWCKVVLNAPGPPRGVEVPVVHQVHSDPL